MGGVLVVYAILQCVGLISFVDDINGKILIIFYTVIVIHYFYYIVYWVRKKHN
jgi:hypothetical protein